MDKKEINKKIAEGWLHTRLIVEMLGKPKEHLDQTMKQYIEKLKDDKDIIVIKEEYSEPEDKEGMFAEFVELEMLFRSIEVLTFFCFDYMPSSVEIIAPEKVSYVTRDVMAFLNDLQARLHTIDLKLKTITQENTNLTHNAFTLLRNLILLSIRQGDKSAAELSEITGIKAEELMKFLDIFEKEENKIKKEGDKYTTIK
ncbi:MAG: hypothetical protein Q7J54_01850 [Candidatus Woesearchaeota archaeon]|nr:hypothetical protein [Candidatus Woesearchaeota archaeon]